MFFKLSAQIGYFIEFLKPNMAGHLSTPPFGHPIFAMQRRGIY
jgi:hypothetical protein